jgi:hypothetical protein
MYSLAFSQITFYCLKKIYSFLIVISYFYCSPPSLVQIIYELPELLKKVAKMFLIADY